MIILIEKNTLVVQGTHALFRASIHEPHYLKIWEKYEIVILVVNLLLLGIQTDVTLVCS